MWFLLLIPGFAADLSGNAPDFTLKNRLGKNIKLTDFRGQVVMINFWAMLKAIGLDDSIRFNHKVALDSSHNQNGVNNKKPTASIGPQP